MNEEGDVSVGGRTRTESVMRWGEGSSPTMSNIAGHFHPQEVRGWIGLGTWEWVVGNRENKNEWARGSGGLGWRETEGALRREEHRSISVPPPSPFRHSHFSPRSALNHSASHPPSFIPLGVSPSFLLFLSVPYFLSFFFTRALLLSLVIYLSPLTNASNSCSFPWTL